jgi:two-component system response regulator PilR (NtrC family)
VPLPPLRDRTEDIPLLAESFLGKFRGQMKKDVRAISREAMECLQAYPWPGNIRELENALERAVALERTPAVLPESLPEHIRTGQPAGDGAAKGDGLPDNGFDLEQHVREIEREYIAEALRRAGGVKVKAAELLGMSFRSFRYYVKKYNL